jgi:hypothetical protein
MGGASLSAGLRADDDEEEEEADPFRRLRRFVFEYGEYHGGEILDVDPGPEAIPREADPRRGEVARQVEAELRSPDRRASQLLDRLSGLFREYDGGAGGVFWHTVAVGTGVLELCFDLLPPPSMEALLRRAVAEHPGVLSRKDGDLQCTLLHLAVRSNAYRGQARPEDWRDHIRLLVELGPAALMIPDLDGALPIHTFFQHGVGVRGDADLEIIQSLVEANPAAAGVRNRFGNLPLHLLCQKLGGDEPQLLAAIRVLLAHHRQALEAGRLDAKTPIMLAIESAAGGGGAARLVPGKLDLLRDMVRLGGPRSLWGAAAGGPSTGAATALDCACRSCPHPDLVSALVGAWPPALCMGLLGDAMSSLPGEIAPAVTAEARAALLALVEVVLHDTTSGAVPGPVRDHVRGAVARFVASPSGSLAGSGCSSSSALARRVNERVRGDSFLRLRADALTHRALQELLAAREDIQGMVTGVYRMNKAGRLGPEPAGGGVDAARARGAAALSAEQRARVLAAAGGNASCLFLHLRDCCPVLLAGFVAGRRRGS